MTVTTVAHGIGKGLVAGLIGTVAMTVSSTIEQKARGRPASSAPAHAAEKALGIEKFQSDAAEQRFSTLVHWGYGTGWGVVRGLLRAAGLPPKVATAIHGPALWGSEQVMLPVLDVAPPRSPFIMAAAQIGMELGGGQATGAAQVAAGLLSVLLFPLVALTILRGSGRPRAASAEAEVEPTTVTTT